MAVTEIQKQIIEELGIVQDFDVDREIKRRINFLKNYLRSAGLKSFILGISGGIDSTTAGTLAQSAVMDLIEEGYYSKFIAVRLPYNVQADESEAQQALDWISPDEVYIVNVEGPTENMMWEVTSNMPRNFNNEDFVKGNVKARQRMIAQYTIAGFEQGIVIGTDHGAEAVMGFFTKFGDGAADILPLSGLNKRRIRAMAKRLGVPTQLVNKVPTADLEDNRPQLPDETAYGVTYDQIDDFLEGKDVGTEVHDIIVAAFNKTKHKRALPISP